MLSSSIGLGNFTDLGDSTSSVLHSWIFSFLRDSCHPSLSHVEIPASNAIEILNDLAQQRGSDWDGNLHKYAVCSILDPFFAKASERFAAFMKSVEQYEKEVSDDRIRFEGV